MSRRAIVTHVRSGLLCFAAVAILACGKKAASDEPTGRATVPATTIVVTPQAFTETLGTIGNVVPRAGHIATLSAPAAGRVAKIEVSLGQSVTAGETLIELDQAPFQSALQSAQAALTAADRANERQQRLITDGIVSRKDVEQAAADAAKANADATAARRTLELSTLRSPINGVVTHLSATLGASADPAQPLVEISDPTALDILFNVTPTDAGRVRPGVKVQLSAGQTESGERLGVGTVMSISGTVDSASRSVSVRVQAPTTRRPLRIGETVFGSIALRTSPSAIVIPADALVPDGEAYKVFVVDEAGTAHERAVKVGGKTSAGVEVTDGLKAGERIVTYGAYGVQDSAKVVPLGTKIGADDDVKVAKDAKDSGEKSAKPAGTKPEKP
ncbi:MAG: efflux RND transporter periplasmic adaptor subunit [Gemmatimonadaceae bacterium]